MIGEINVAMYSVYYFDLMVKEHRMEALECIFLPADKVFPYSFINQSINII